MGTPPLPPEWAWAASGDHILSYMCSGRKPCTPEGCRLYLPSSYKCKEGQSAVAVACSLSVLTPVLSSGLAQRAEAIWFCGFEVIN